MSSGLIVFDRSRAQTWRECPRKRVLAYDLPTKGVGGRVPRKTSVYLLVGTGVHDGLEAILRGQGEDAAVEKAVGKFRSRVLEEGMSVDSWSSQESEDLARFHMEQYCAFIEGMVRGANRSTLRYLLENCRLLEVETDRKVEIAPGLAILHKPDGLLLTGGELVVLSWKTAASYGPKEELRYRVGLQTVTDIEGYNTLFRQWEARERQDVPEWFDSVRAQKGAPLEVGLVQMGIMVKGIRRENPEKSGRFVQYSPLLGGWKNEGAGETQYSPVWEVEKVNAKTGQTYKGNLGSSWKRFFCWEEMGAKRWIEYLEREFPMLLAEQFLFPEPFDTARVRTAERMQTLIQQELGYAMRISTSEGMNREIGEIHEQSCISYQQKCSYYGVCWENADVMDDALYQDRQPHHEGEAEE